MAVKNFGIDLSYANKINDYGALLASDYNGHKIKYAILRLGYIGKVDTRFAEHYAALSGKIPLGVYVYSYARTTEEAKAEARWALKQIKELNIEFPVIFDYEDSKVLSPKLSKAEYTAICKAFLDEIKAAGYYAMMYCNPSFIEMYADKAELLKYPLWLAHYTDDGKQKQYGQKMWQFGTFKPAGAVGEIDGNYAYEQLGRYIRENGLNKPIIKYKVIGTKTVTKADLGKAQAQLIALGFDVDAEVL